MPKIMTLAGPSLGATEGQCKCVYNPRTKRSAKLCFVGKSKRTRSGWMFRPGGCEKPRR